MITLRALVSATPFDEETKNTVLGKIDQNLLDEDQQYQMSELCWSMITDLYGTELQIKIDDMMRQQAEGEKSFTQHDFAEEEVKLMQEFASKLETATSAEALAEVKKQLALHTAKPLMNPPVSS
jgi:hypothetical protein